MIRDFSEVDGFERPSADWNHHANENIFWNFLKTYVFCLYHGVTSCFMRQLLRSQWFCHSPRCSFSERPVDFLRVVEKWIDGIYSRSFDQAKMFIPKIVVRIPLWSAHGLISILHMSSIFLRAKEEPQLRVGFWVYLSSYLHFPFCFVGMTMSSEEERWRADIGRETDRVPTNFLDSFVDRECNRRLIVRSRFIESLEFSPSSMKIHFFLWLFLDFT
jgi:hypothetical protein